VAIWAGDLRGNMWKFDVNSPNRSDWQVAFGGNPLFTTPTNQPITVMPELARFPNSNQAMVLFGTGKLFDTQDNATDSTNQNLTRQALYGIWDNESTRVTSRSQLAEQTVLPGNTNSYRRTSENPIDWATQRGWFLQLEDGTGERVHVNPLIPVEGRAVPAFFVANTPTNVPCSSGGTSRVFALDPITGQTPRFSVFDTNRRDGINAADGRNNVMSVSVGILSLPSFLVGRTAGGVVPEKSGSRGQTGAREGGVEFRDGGSSMTCSSASNGRMIGGVSDTSAVNEAVRLSECKGRVSWRQIQ
jgi:type IV pilus assembly protein PilY1